MTPGERSFVDDAWRVKAYACEPALPTTLWQGSLVDDAW
jgi:hypothetical protein